MRVLAAGLGDQDGVAAALGELAVDKQGDLGRAGEDDALDARVGDQRSADGGAVAGEELEDVGGHAGAVEQADGVGGDQRGLLGGLGEDGVAGGERSRDLAGEDGEREVPGGDADHRAQGLVGAVVELGADAGGVVAAEVDRLAHLAHARWAGSCRPRGRPGR